MPLLFYQLTDTTTLVSYVRLSALSLLLYLLVVGRR